MELICLLILSIPYIRSLCRWIYYFVYVPEPHPYLKYSLKSLEHLNLFDSLEAEFTTWIRIIVVSIFIPDPWKR